MALAVSLWGTQGKVAIIKGSLCPTLDGKADSQKTQGPPCELATPRRKGGDKGKDTQSLTDASKLTGLGDRRQRRLAGQAEGYPDNGLYEANPSKRAK